MPPRRGQRVTLIRPPQRNRNGDWVDPQDPQVPIENAVVIPRTSTETDDRAAAGVVVGLTVHLPPAAAQLVTSRDQLRVDDLDYDIDGEPALWRSPYTGQVRGVVLTLTRAQGS